MKHLHLIGFGFTALLACAAQADCVSPRGPSSIPDGTTATEAEMIAVMQAFKRYNTDIATYAQCLEDETAVLLRNGTLSPEALDKLEENQVQRHNDAVVEAEVKAVQFNEQIKIFRARQQAAR